MKLSWQKQMQATIDFQHERIRDLQAENKYLRTMTDSYGRMVSGPPTVLIACERIAESAAQLASTANAMLQRREQDYAKR